MHPAYSIPVFLTSIGVAAFGLFVFSRNPRNPLNQLFGASAASVAFWSLGYGLLYSTADPVKAIAYARLGYLGVVFIPPTFCHFTVRFLGENRKKFLSVVYALSAIFLVVSQLDVFLDGVYLYPWGYYPKAGPLYAAFIAYFYGCFGTCVAFLLRVLLKAKKEGRSPTFINQVKYVFVAFCVASASFSDYLPNYHIQVYPGAYLAAAGWLVVMAYGTLRYRVIDINLIIRKTLIYSVVTGILIGIYVLAITIFTKLFQGLTGYETLFSSGVAAGLITVCVQPLKKKIQVFVDSKFFRQYVDREEKLYELSRDVVTHTTPEDMGNALMRVLGDTVHPKLGVLYLRSRDGLGFVPVSKVGDGKTFERLADDNPLARYFADHPQPFVQEVYSDVATPKDTRRPAEGERRAGTA